MFKLRTSEEWSDILLDEGTRVLDPDGWDRKNFKFSWSEEEITSQEFIKRFMSSTIMTGVGVNHAQ